MDAVTLREFLTLESEYGSGSGSGYGYGDGDGDGYGYGYGSEIKSLCGEDVHMIDGVPTIITRVRGNVAKGKIVRSYMGTEAAYIVKGGNCFAHGRTLHEAWAALEDKLFEDMPVEERIDAFAAEFKPGEARTVADFYAWHHKLTGSCTQGRDAFARDHGPRRGQIRPAAVYIGRRLVEVKELLGHGEWGAYLRDEFDWSQDRANQLMKLFREYGAGQQNLFRGRIKFRYVSEFDVFAGFAPDCYPRK